ncbi:formylglycine-generating enzyme family protein [Alicyclobacillus acidoterrestris]|uniref:formylglycine-generating enzyme family protein n=1 Tax=Alicyclobacillus acidoterrestris TaxID=1450 RepID=UPI000386C9A4|nr:hypothetical protein N007_14800 [Alicyclobacillus acidoterrestris ATCC 49025]
MTERQLNACCGVPRNTFAKSAETQIHAGSDGELVNRAPLASGHRQGMVLIQGGRFLMGTDDAEGFVADGEGPVHEVELSPFWMDVCAVTNRRFKRFVEETGYTTEAERFGWSFVFRDFVPRDGAVRMMGIVQTAPWWVGVEGAYWAAPEGPGSNIFDRLDHPVVHISWNDAVAFCEWSGTRLPTEAEWEYAARGGLVQNRYAWGDELHPNGEYRCNIWQGEFPVRNKGLDGYLGTAPAKSFQPNGYGLYNVCGNVWEWCADWFDRAYYRTSPLVNPRGPSSGESRVMRGGSYLCHASYCNRYRVAARTSNTPDSSSGHVGFRCVADV